jgi:hypothetical protein
MPVLFVNAAWFVKRIFHRRSGETVISPCAQTDGGLGLTA